MGRPGLFHGPLRDDDAIAAEHGAYGEELQEDGRVEPATRRMVGRADEHDWAAAAAGASFNDRTQVDLGQRRIDNGRTAAVDDHIASRPAQPDHVQGSLLREQGARPSRRPEGVLFDLQADPLPNEANGEVPGQVRAFPF